MLLFHHCYSTLFEKGVKPGFILGESYEHHQQEHPAYQPEQVGDVKRHLPAEGDDEQADDNRSEAFAQVACKVEERVYRPPGLGRVYIQKNRCNIRSSDAYGKSRYKTYDHRRHETGIRHADLRGIIKDIRHGDNPQERGCSA